MNTRQAFRWVLFWGCLALSFNLGIYLIFGEQKALEFLGGYIIEQVLSLDNLFLFIVVFKSFGISPRSQRRVLNYGIMGAIVMRLIFVLLGVTVVNKFHWVLYIFGAALIISGFKMMFKHEEKNPDFKNNRLVKVLRKVIPVTDKLVGEKFFIKIDNVLHATPLLVIVVIIEGTDILFAIDSIPAIFSITTDAFIVYTSNIFAILGLRSLYFLLVKINDTFKYVDYGVALILVFTGIKLSILMFNIKISIAFSIIIIAIILLTSILVSIIANIFESKKHSSHHYKTL